MSQKYYKTSVLHHYR